MSRAEILGPLPALNGAALGKPDKARRMVRRHVWSLLHLRPGGFPCPTVAGKRLNGWIVIDMDGAIITAAPEKDRAAVGDPTSPPPAA